MTTIKKILFAFVLIAGISSLNTASAQDYKTALGVKVWDGGGISFKQFVNGNNALELIGYFWNRGTRITGLYEIHGPITGASGLQWYIGPGAHVGFYNFTFAVEQIGGGCDFHRLIGLGDFAGAATVNDFVNDGHRRLGKNAD